jgi:hypothetical protein
MAEPCVGSMAYAQTKRTCEGLAARLPTVAELKAGSVIVDEATMCGEDPATRMVWTSEECDGGNGVMSASVDGRGTLSCLPKHGIAARLCVAASDAMVTRFIPGNKQRARRPRGITVNNGNTTLALDLQWDPCLEKVVRSPSYRSVTRGGCTCAKGSDGRTQTCQRLPATDIVRMRERRAKHLVPLGFDPDRERSQWRMLYLERCSDTSSAAGGGSAARSWATGSRRG